jgi:Kef-type K+ transport system membrane component KefB
MGFLAAGLLLGPTGFDLISGSAAGAATAAFWRTASNVGLAALMITAGMSMSAQSRVGSWRLALLFSAAILSCFAPAFFSAPFVAGLGPDSAGTEAPHLALAYQGALALAVVVTSVPFLTKILANTGLLTTPFGGVVLSAACAVDLVVWSVFPVLVDIRNREAFDLAASILRPATTILMFLCVAGLASGKAAWDRTHSGSGPTPGALYVVVLAGLALTFATQFEVSVMLASLAFGLGLSGSGRKADPRTDLFGQVLARVLVPTYFALVGAGIDLHRDVAPTLILGFLVWSSLIKISIVAIAAAASRAGFRTSLAYGLALNTRGGPGIALASLAISSGIIGEATFLAFVIASIATSVMAEFGLRRLLKPSTARTEGLPPLSRPTAGRSRHRSTSGTF